MAIIKCKMCGGDIELSADKTYGICEYCGNTITLPKVDNDQRAAAFNRGNHFRRIGEFDKALAVYERIVAEDDSDAEAHWCCALCRYGIEYVEDPATYEWLPTCHRASFDSFLEDVDYLAAVANSDGITRRQYQKDAAKIAEVQRGILATSQSAEPYDVFISYKELDENGNRTRDSILAQDIYYQLTEKGWRVFFSRISLEDVPGTQYEPYIFAALNSAKVMVAVGTSGENLNAVWVKNEWSRFLSLMRKDRSKLLLPCYRDMDPYNLPEQLSVLMSYDMGKIGFIQDLIRGIDKVLSADRPKEIEHETIKETVVVQQSSGGANVTALLKRGNMALEDKNWEAAKDFFNRVLDMDAECADAYLGQFLAEQEFSSAEQFVSDYLESHKRCKSIEIELCPKDAARIDRLVKEYTVTAYLKDSYIRSELDFNTKGHIQLSNRLKQIEEAKEFFADDTNFARALRFASGESLKRIKKIETDVISGLTKRADIAKAEDDANRASKATAYAEHLEKAELRIKERYEKAIAEREKKYEYACAYADRAMTVDALSTAAKLFSSDKLKAYKDSAQRVALLDEKANQLIREQRARDEAEKARLAQLAAEEAERKHVADEKKKKERQAKAKKIAIVVAGLAVLAVVAFLIMPKSNKLEPGSIEVSSPTSTPSTTSAPAEQNTITINGVEYEAKNLGRSDLSASFADLNCREFWLLPDAYDDFLGYSYTGNALPQRNYPVTLESGQFFVIEYTRKDGSTWTEYHICTGEERDGMVLTREINISSVPQAGSININGVEYKARSVGKQELSTVSDFKSREFWLLPDAYDDFLGCSYTGNALPQSNYPVPLESGQFFVIEYTRKDGSTKTEYHICTGDEHGGMIITREIILDSKVNNYVARDTFNIKGVDYKAKSLGKYDLSAYSEKNQSREFWLLPDAYDDFAGCSITGNMLPQSNYPVTLESGQFFVIEYTRKDGSTWTEYHICTGKIVEGMMISQEIYIN